MPVLKLEDAISPGYRLFLERLVEAYMARKNLTVMPGYIGDRTWYVTYLLSDICIELGESSSLLFTGHARTRKRLQAQQYKVKPADCDPALDVALKQALAQHFAIWQGDHPGQSMTAMFLELGQPDEKEARRRDRIKSVKAKLAHALATPEEAGLVDYLREALANLERMAPKDR